MVAKCHCAAKEKCKKQQSDFTDRHVAVGLFAMLVDCCVKRGTPSDVLGSKIGRLLPDGLSWQKKAVQTRKPNMQ